MITCMFYCCLWANHYWRQEGAEDFQIFLHKNFSFPHILKEKYSMFPAKILCFLNINFMFPSDIEKKMHIPPFLEI